MDIGVAVIDSFTYHVLHFMEGINKTSDISVQDLVDTYSFDKIHSHAGVRSELFNRPLWETRITDFFGNVADVQVVDGFDDVVVHVVDEKKGDTADDDAHYGVGDGDGDGDGDGSETEHRTARLWAAFGLFGGLLGIVIARSFSIM